MSRQNLVTGLLCSCTALVVVGSPAWAQPTFSIDFQGPTNGTPDPSGMVITEGDILIPGLGVPAPGPLGPPKIVIPAGPPGTGLGLGTYPRVVEVDALSYGQDKLCGYWHFSVDEFATGIPSANVPDVFSEGCVGNREASADIFVGLGVLVHPTVPPPPPGTVLTNLDVIDGDGLPPFGGPGVGLKEPNPPTPGQIPDYGDNLDAVDMDTRVVSTDMPVFFSLDSHFVEPIEGPPANLGTALLNGFVGGDVLMSFWGGPPMLYAPAWMLGLDVEGQDYDDLDALVLLEDGDMQYDPQRDFIAFSVRRGSLVIGMPDSIWGAPISEADILVPPSVGGASPFPGILVPGEALGLVTLRKGQGEFGPDDLNALDVTRLPGDCDGNGSVNVFDVIIVINAFGSNPGSINWDPRADLDCNNVVDVFDVITVINNFGNTW